MADIRKLYPSASALGGTNSFSGARSESFLIEFRNGDTFSYSYRFVSGIETVGEQRVEMLCTDRNVKAITISGTNLRRIAEGLRNQTISKLEESSRPAYTRPEETLIEKIVVQKTPQN